MAKVDAGDVGGNPLRWGLYFEGDGTFRPALAPIAETWAGARDVAAWALDVRAETFAAGRWRYALAYDVQRMAELAARVALGSFPGAHQGARFLAAERALRESAGDLDGERADLEAFAFRLDVIVARALAAPPTPKHCARLAWWLARWAGLALEHVASVEALPSARGDLATPVYASTRELAAELLRSAQFRAGRGEAGAAHVAGIAALIVRELERGDGAPFEGVDLPAAATPAPRAPSEVFARVLARVQALPEEDLAGGAFIAAALSAGWGPAFGDDPREAAWDHWHERALERCRERAAHPRGRRGDDPLRKVVRGALAELGHDPDTFAGNAYKVESRKSPHTRRAEAKRAAAERARKRATK